MGVKSGKQKTSPPNPNGANQFLLDPRQKLCWENYSNPKSPTFGNATQSAVSAGYEHDYADQITMTEWFKGKVWRLNGTFRGEKKIDELINLPIKNDVGYDVGIIRVQADLAKYLTSTLGKEEGYSSRSELTGKDGEKLMPVPLLSAIDTSSEEN